MRNQRKRRKIIKRLISGVSALALSVGLLGSIPASADDSNVGYKYTLFAYSCEEGAITSSAANFCVNGNIATNGTISASQNFNVNGEKKEHAKETMPDISNSINEKFFAENVDVKTENYKNEDVNINVVSPLDVKGKAELNGNIKLAAGVKAMGDIVLSGGVLNNDNTVLFSENGNVVINSENVSLTGLIYAPKGNIVIDSKNLNLNSVVMIANKITLNAPNININNSTSMAKFVQESIDKNGNSSSGDENEEDPEPVTDPAIYAYGEYNEETKSVDIEWYSNVTGEFAVLESLNGTDYTVVSKVSNDTKCSIKVTSDFIKKLYKVTIIKDGKTIESIPFSIVNANGKYSTELLDTDKDGLADLYEEMLGTDKTLPDTDKDGLTDYEEAYITNTNPTKYDSVTEGVSDADADNDKDGLTNKREIELKTDPNSDDTDGDNLKDGDEISKYNTDSLKKDTDGDDLEDDDEFKFKYDPNKKDTDNNGIIDGKEKHQQTLDVVPDNKEQAVTKVNISMAATGNIEKTTTVESIMNKDVLCSNVVGLVGEPFSIESKSSFDKATITFTVDKTKLGETEFDNLMFLWYDRENDNFVELETSHDAANSTVSIETTHFSEYMVVDSQKWFDNWRQIEADWKKHSTSGSNVLHKINPLATILYIKCYPSSDPDFINPDPDNTIMSHYTNYRTLISESLINSMWETDIMKIAYTTNNMYSTLSGKLNEPGWEDSEAAGDFCSDKTILRKRLNLFLNDVYKTSILRDLYWASIDLSRKNDVDRRIVYITDHDGPLDYSVFEGRTPEVTERIKSAYYSVPVYFVCIGDFEKPNLEKIAQETGGKVYKVATLNGLYSELTPSLIFPEAKDTDKDGFSDDEETYGLIVDSSGTRYKTNPDKEDSDEDDLKDNEEVEVKRSLEKGKDKYGKEVYKWYHHMKSDPTKKDTDDDGYYDKKDPRPNESDVIITKLKNDYIRIDHSKESGNRWDISYGGDQGWFGNIEDYPDKDIVSNQGCGLIAMCDTILYLAKTNEKYRTELTNRINNINSTIPFDEYFDFVKRFNDYYARMDMDDPLEIKLFCWTIKTIDFESNTNDGHMGDILTSYFSNNDINLDASWCITENNIYADGHWFELNTRDRRIKEMISNDIPAIISIGPGKGLNFYSKDEENLDKPAYCYETKKDSHYVTITAVIEDRIKSQNGEYDSVMYEISSWGKKYYISQKELREHVNGYWLGSIVTNVCYIKEK